jgi:hypothetical protein
MDELRRCTVCDRTPLVGEQVGVVSSRGREAIVCLQCAATPRALALGAPDRQQRVRSAVGAASVRNPAPTPSGGEEIPVIALQTV